MLIIICSLYICKFYIGLLRLNIDKSRKELGWEPKYNAKEAVQETIAWYKASKAEEGIKAFTENQIAKFFND